MAATRTAGDATVGEGATPERPAELAAHLRGMWSAVAPAWAEHASYVDGRSADLTAAMLRRVAPRPGERVLELACGAGGLSLAAAPLVAPGGEVVASDVAPEMCAIAAARAEAAGLRNVTARVLALEAIDEPDEAYDVVLCREGLMFAVDPARGAAEVRRVLRPGGRVAIAVWGPRERNPWLGVALDAAAAVLGRPMPPPGRPGPFALSDAGALAGLLRDAGLADVAVHEHDVPLVAASFDEWWARTTALAGPLARVLAGLPDDGARALRARARDAVRPYEAGPGALAFPGLTLLATASQPRTGR